MQLNINFTELHELAEIMGARKREIDFGELVLSDIDRIDLELQSGIEVNIDEIEILENGLLSYKGRQILLYIQDHGIWITKALDDNSKGNKYHVSYCSTLESMKEKGRYNRYVVKNDISGNFTIDGKDEENVYVSGNARLDICKHCLSELNYQEYSINKQQVFSNFSLKEFFENYQSYFKFKPKYKEGEVRSIYTDDWPEISKKYRESKKWVCEECNVNLSYDKDLLHVHHKDGVKSNNSTDNLQALCVECHKTCSGHNHLRLSDEDKDKLHELRHCE